MTELNKLNMKTLDGISENIEKIEKLFPNCITESKDENGNLKKSINFEVLKQLLSKDIAEGRENYEFTWPGKKAAILEANTPITKTLRPCVEDSKNWENTKNLYIEGDNLEALKILQESYIGKVKMIYIDPPYNTGNDFVYKDDFSKSESDYSESIGQKKENGERLFKNTESNGRFHSDWCSMIYSRLLLARNMLSEEGVIFISIDENEFENLTKIADEIFGKSNNIGQFVWAGGRKNDSKFISVSHEYILCFVKNIEFLKNHKIVWREKKSGLEKIYSEFEKLKQQYSDNYELIETELKKWFKTLPESDPAREHSHYCSVDDRGIYFADNISWPGGGGPKYDVLHPKTGKPVKIPSRGWLTNKETLEKWIKDGLVKFGPDENYVPQLKAYLKNREYAVPYSVIYKDGRASSKRLKSLMGEKIFENPKDEEIISRLISLCLSGENQIVLDFFSGSGTTAHSVFLSNISKSVNAKFILVQLPETISVKAGDSEKTKKVATNATQFLKSINKPINICEIGKERIRRAGEQIKKEHPETNVDVGFRVFKVDSSNMKDVYYNPEFLSQDLLLSLESNIKEDRSDLDLLFGCILDLGLTLDKEVKEETIGDTKVYIYNDDEKEGPDLIACFADSITEDVITAIAKRNPLKAVFKDSSFENSPSKINLFELFKTYANISDDNELQSRVRVI